MIRPIVRLVDPQLSTNKRLGFAREIRLAEQVREIDKAGRYSGIIRPQTRLAYINRAAKEWLGLSVTRLRLKQKSELIEQPPCRVLDLRLVCATRYRERMRRERVERRPVPY